MSKKVIVVFGTRPEAIKMCPLVKELKNHEKFDVKVLVTGQHAKMLDSVLECFDVKPDFNLKIMKEKQTLFDITQNILAGIKPILEKENPDIVLVHGDTTTSFSTALACFYLNIKVGHVEAGLRTYTPLSPYPEEFNRQAVGSIAHYNFAPTKSAAKNLLNEKKDPSSIFVTGNTVIDALRTTVKNDFKHPLLDWVGDDRLILLTAHRRENLGKPMSNMFKAIRKIVEEFSDVKVLYPIHMNPKVREIASQELSESNKIKLVEPLDVLEFHNIMSKAHIILTDSGGIQEEAPSLGVPVLVMRETTERPEGVKAGTLKLVGTETDRIYKETKKLLTNKNAYEKMAKSANPYGDGQASERISGILRSML